MSWQGGWLGRWAGGWFGPIDDSLAGSLGATAAQDAARRAGEAAARPGPPPDAVLPHAPANPAYVPMYAGPPGITAPRRPSDLRARLLVIAALALDN